MSAARPRPGNRSRPRFVVAPRVFRAPEAPAAVCASGRRPAREPSVRRASLGASSRSPARPRRRPSISHVIPLRLVQTLNLHRWNCNVFGVSQKMTTINYVRNLGGGSVVAARRHRSQAPPSPTGTAAWPCRHPPISHVIPLRLIRTLNSHRWNCNVFAWSRKVTVGNYVRLLVSAGPPAAFFAAVGPCVSQPARALRRSASVCVFWIGSSVLDRNGASG